MRLLLAGIVLILIVGTEAQWNFPIQAAHGVHDMWHAYRDLIKSSGIGADKYFHARGNFDAAQRGPGGRWVEEVIRIWPGRLAWFPWCIPKELHLLTHRYGSIDSGFVAERELVVFPEARQPVDRCDDPNIEEFILRSIQQMAQKISLDCETALEVYEILKEAEGC